MTKATVKFSIEFTTEYDSDNKKDYPDIANVEVTSTAETVREMAASDIRNLSIQDLVDVADSEISVAISWIEVHRDTHA